MYMYTLLVAKDTEVFLVLEGKVQLDKEWMVYLQKYFSFSFHIRNLLLSYNVMFTKYFHWNNTQVEIKLQNFSHALYKNIQLEAKISC